MLKGPSLGKGPAIGTHTIYGLVVSGYFKIGAEIMKSFIIWKERSHLVHQFHLTLCPVSFAKGLEISAK